MSGRGAAGVTPTPRGAAGSPALVGSALHTALGITAGEVAAALAQGATAHRALDADPRLGWPHLVAAPLAWETSEDEDDPQMRILGVHGQRMEPVCVSTRAHLTARGHARERIGLYVGMGMIDAAPEDLVAAVRASTRPNGTLDLRRFFRSGYRALHPLWPLSMLNNVAAGQLATDLDIRGDNLVLAAEATSGLGAMLEAMRSVREGRLDGALAVGVSERLSHAGIARHASVGTLCETPGGPGWVLGEGASALAIARPDDRGGDPDPGGSGPGLVLAGGCVRFGPRALVRAIKQTLADLGWAAREIDLVVCHGTGDPTQGTAECKALGEVFGAHMPVCATPSTGLGDLGPATAPTHTALAEGWLRGAPLPATAGTTSSAGTLAAEASRALVLVTDARGGSGCLAVQAPEDQA